MKALTVALLVGAMMALTAATGASNNETMSSSEGHDRAASLLSIGGWSLHGDRYLLYEPTVLTWANAEKNCQKKGGNLASVKSFDENRKIQGMIITVTSVSPDTWIGGSDAQQDGSWLWSDGTQFKYQRWCSYNNAGCKNCTIMNSGGCWVHFLCSDLRPSVCAKKLQ